MFDFDTSLWDEIADAPGEIFDIDEQLKEFHKVCEMTESEYDCYWNS